MKNLILIIGLLFVFMGVKSQESKKIRITDAAFSLGYYNPSLDYWKNESEFHEADFHGAAEVSVSTGVRLIDHLILRPGIGIWQSKVEENLQGFGKTYWSLTGYSLMLDLNYSAEALRFLKFIPFIAAGSDYLTLRQKLRFERKDDPAPVSGSTIVFKSAIGLNTRLSEYFSVGLEVGYRWGFYEQEFVKYVKDPAGNLIAQSVTEKISLDGFRPMLTLKFHFH